MDLKFNVETNELESLKVILKYESCTQIGCFKLLGKLGTVLKEERAQGVFAPGRPFLTV
jgi:hypothetical protein